MCEMLIQSVAIPIINISPFIESATLQEKLVVADDIRDACTNFGFFYLVGHGIPEELIVKMRKAAKDFFDLPLHEKLKISISNGDKARGYQSIV